MRRRRAGRCATAKLTAKRHDFERLQQRRPRIREMSARYRDSLKQEGLTMLASTLVTAVFLAILVDLLGAT